MTKTKSEIKFLEQIKDLNGKCKWFYNVDKHFRRQTFAIIKINNKYYIGHALCAIGDSFSRKVGRIVSLSRAWKEYENKNEASIANGFKFKEDQEGVKKEKSSVKKFFGGK